MAFEEKTWEEVTTPDYRTGKCLIEGGIGPQDDEWRAKVLERLEDTKKWPRVKYVVMLQNEDLCSSKFGAYNVTIAGEGYTWGDDEIADMAENRMKYKSGDLPSTFMYPQWFISREKHLEAKNGAA